MTMIKIAVIGVGYLGRHHARIFSSLEGAELYGIADPDPGRASEAAQATGAKPCSDFREFLPLVDAVSVVTPTETHHGIALECLRAGKSVFLEKPITSTVQQADSLIEEAAKRGLVLQVGHIERFNPAAEEFARIAARPGFIEAERVSPFQGRGTDVDITLDLMIHDIDIALSLFGSPAVSRIKAAGSSVLTETLDYVKAWVDFEGGQSAVFTAGRVSPEKRRIMRAIGDEKYIEVDFMNRKLLERSRRGEREFQAGDAEPLREELKDFIGCIKAGRAPRVKPVEARAALELALKISEEARRNSR